MHETPPIPPVEEPAEVERAEQPPIPIEEWAKQNNHESLLRHIDSSHETDANVGVFRKNLEHDPIAKTTTLTVPIKDIHRGHTFESKSKDGEVTQTEIMLGGVPAFFMDVTSGALAFTEIPPHCVPIHLKVEVTKGAMIIQRDDIPVVVVSSFEEVPVKGGKKFFIKTVASQGPNICAIERSEVRVIAEQAAGMMAERINVALDQWLEEQKLGTSGEE